MLLRCISDVSVSKILLLYLIYISLIYACTILVMSANWKDQCSSGDLWICTGVEFQRKVTFSILVNKLKTLALLQALKASLNVCQASLFVQVLSPNMAQTCQVCQGFFHPSPAILSLQLSIKSASSSNVEPSWNEHTLDTKVKKKIIMQSLF